MNKNWDKISEILLEEGLEKQEIKKEDLPMFSWRGDGKFYSINTLDGKIYNKKGNGKRHIFVIIIIVLINI
jgi:hypothetical protein